MSNNKSGYLGVWFDAERNRWASEIKIDDKKCYLGRYKFIQDAVYARYLAETLLFKEYRSDRNDERILEAISKCENKDYIEGYVKHRLYDIYKI